MNLKLINDYKFLLVSIGALIAFVFQAFTIYDLYKDEVLWGHRLLVAWVTFLVTYISFFLHVFRSDSRNTYRLLLSTLSGFLLYIGFMPNVLIIAMFVGFVPLFMVYKSLVDQASSRLAGPFFLYCFHGLFVWNILSTWWIQNSSFIAGVFGNTLNAIFMCLPFLVYHFTHKHVSERASKWGFVGFWLSFEYGHMNWDLSWPWLTLGNGFAHSPWLVQWYEFSGVLGGSLWVLILNVWVYHILVNRQESWLQTILHHKWALFVLFFPVALSIILNVLRKSISEDKRISISVVQPNYEPHYQKFYTPATEHLAKYVQLIKEKVPTNTDFVLIPETAFSRINVDQLNSHYVIRTLRSMLDTMSNTSLVMGLSAFKEYGEDDVKPDHLFTYCNKDRTVCRYIDSYNASILLDGVSDNQDVDIPLYKKSKLVPGAESMPFIGDLPFFKGLILDMGGAPGLSLGTQKMRSVFTSNHGVSVAPMICYESIYGDFVTDFVKNGANILFVLTNDGWWDNTAGHVQHMHLSRLRAIETRRSVVRCANTGISCFIDPWGHVYDHLDYEKEDVLTNSASISSELTFYVQYGDLIGRVSLLITFLLITTILANLFPRKSDTA